MTTKKIDFAHPTRDDIRTIATTWTWTGGETRPETGDVLTYESPAGDIVDIVLDISSTDDFPLEDIIAHACAIARTVRVCSWERAEELDICPTRREVAVIGQWIVWTTAEGDNIFCDSEDDAIDCAKRKWAKLTPREQKKHRVIAEFDPLTTETDSDPIEYDEGEVVWDSADLDEEEDE